MQVRNADALMTNLRSTTFYRGIQRTIEENEEKIGDVNEATEAAWHERRFALKQFVKDNEDAIGGFLFESEQSDSD